MTLEIIITVAACACAVFGIIGSIIPALPGPPVGWVGMLLLYIWGGQFFGHSMPMWMLVTCGILMAVVTVLDYVVPAKFTQMTGGSKASSRGSLVGLLIGMFFTPVGMILGAFVGAVLAEMIVNGNDLGSSVKAGFGAFLGFLAGTGMKLVVSIVFLVLTIWYL